MTDSRGNIEKATSERLEAVLGELSSNQIRFVVAMQECSTQKMAAEQIGLKPVTVYSWPPIVEEAIKLMAADGLIAATHIRRRNLAKAMSVKVAGLDEKDSNLRQRVATEIIEWEMGQAPGKLDVTSKGEQVFADTRAELDRRIARLIAADSETDLPGQPER